MPKNKPPSNAPEVKFGPYAGSSISVAVWVNTIETANGPRQMRSVTISPRRYFDQQSGEWKDSSSYRPNDLPVLLHALQKAWQYVLDTPLPGDNGKE